MTIFGVDIHPQYQKGISIEQIRHDGFDFMACKLSEGTSRYDSHDWIRRGRAAGLICLGYHYLRPGDEAGQATVFADQLRRSDVAGMLDAEALGSDGKTATLTIDSIRKFLRTCRELDVHVPLLYLPRWYWQRMGSPRLDGLPLLWASSYPSTRSDIATELYRSVTTDRWTSYGGLPIGVLQFTDKARVAGREIDANAFLGSRDQFAALIGEDDMPTAKEIWDYPIEDVYPDAKPKPARLLVSWAATHAAFAKEQVLVARAEIAALRLAIAEIAAQHDDLNAEELIEAMDKRFREALKEGMIDVEVVVRDKTDDDETKA